MAVQPMAVQTVARRTVAPVGNPDGTITSPTPARINRTTLAQNHAQKPGQNREIKQLKGTVMVNRPNPTTPKPRISNRLKPTTTGDRTPRLITPIRPLNPKQNLSPKQTLSLPIIPTLKAILLPKGMPRRKAVPRGKAVPKRKVVLRRKAVPTRKVILMAMPAAHPLPTKPITKLRQVHPRLGQRLAMDLLATDLPAMDLLAMELLIVDLRAMVRAVMDLRAIVRAIMGRAVMDRAAMDRAVDRRKPVHSLAPQHRLGNHPIQT
jgi:hypothetical protein